MYMIFNRNKLRDRLDDSTLRLLTETEIEWVAGGSGSYGSGGAYSDEIVVVGKRYKRNVQFNYWFLIDTGDTGSGYGYGDIPGMGYGSDPTPDPTPPPPPPPTLEQQAKEYADKTVKHGEGFDPNNPAHVKMENDIKDALKNAFKAAHDGVEGSSRLTDGSLISDERLRTVLDHVELTLQTKDFSTGKAGDYIPWRNEQDVLIHNIAIDIDNRNFDLLRDHFGSEKEAANFTALHEIGHAISKQFGLHGASSSIEESYANYYAMQLGSSLGMAMPTDAEMQSAGYSVYRP